MYCTRVLLGGVSAGGVCAQCLSFCCLEHTWLQVKYNIKVQWNVISKHCFPTAGRTMVLFSSQGLWSWQQSWLWLEEFRSIQPCLCFFNYADDVTFDSVGYVGIGVHECLSRRCCYNQAIVSKLMHCVGISWAKTSTGNWILSLLIEWAMVLLFKQKMWTRSTTTGLWWDLGKSWFKWRSHS